MLIEEVRKLPPLERLIYWVRERHAIYLRRRASKLKPWTDDTILQSQFFTNPYRENDKTTVWFRENIRDPLRNDPNVLLAIVIFRWFNYIPTGEVLVNSGLDTDWDSLKAIRLLGSRRDRGEQIFTGAFMINSPAGEPKLEAICRRIDNVWGDRENILKRAARWKTLEQAHGDLRRYDGLGGFMAYEIVTDLRYTALLEHASDIMTWSNPGPGAVRGLYRVLGRDFPKGNNATSPPVPKDWREQTVKLLAILQERLPSMPMFEMRTIEHSLCEFDKMERLLWGDGRAKRRYNGR